LSESKSIDRWKWNEGFEELAVTFRSGAEYSYSPVTREMILRLLDAPSPNGFLQNTIAKTPNVSYYRHE